MHLFQGFVNVDALRIMGAPEADWCLSEVQNLNREVGITLLDRADEIGHLTAIGDGCYTIHPVLPWFLKSLFDKYYVSAAGDKQEMRAARASVEAISRLGNYYADQYEHGNRDAITVLTYEETNLLHVRQLARKRGWWNAVISTMRGLQVLYHHRGRRTEWARLVNEIVPDFVDTATDGPLQGREEQWSLVTGYRVRLAREARQWTEAVRLQRDLVDWNHKRAAVALAASPKALDRDQCKSIRMLAASLHELGEIQREVGQPKCVPAYEEALALVERIDERAGAAICTLSLGNAYLSISALRDLDQAEQWYQRSLELCDERDRLGRARCLGQMGLVAYERFNETHSAKQPEEELLCHINDALRCYQQALDMLPTNAIDDLAVVHNQLGNIYRDADDFNHARLHYLKTIHYREIQGNLYGAAQTHYNVALSHAGTGRFADALDYAYAAMRNYETYDDRAAEEMQRTRDLIAQIEQDLKSKGG